jgi:hypothetical protein
MLSPSMAIVVQVAVEYGALASRNGGNRSFGDLVDAVGGLVSSEYFLIGLGAVVVVYLVTRLL